MNFIRSRVALVVSVVAILLLISGAYIFGILCIGKFCVNNVNGKETFQINKLVSNPQTKTMVDNLGASDPKFAPGSIVSFQLRVVNTSDVSISGISIKDIFPQFIDFDKGTGTFDSKAKTLTINTSLKPKEAKVFNFSGKVSKNLSFSQDVLCVSNEVNAAAGNGVKASDNARFCLEKKRLTSTPATGPQSLTLFLLIPIAIFGWNLRKYSVKGISNN